jgi:hypothetical protein
MRSKTISRVDHRNKYLEFTIEFITPFTSYRKEVPKRMEDERSGFCRETFYRIKGSLAMQLNQYFE